MTAPSMNRRDSIHPIIHQCLFQRPRDLEGKLVFRWLDVGGQVQKDVATLRAGLIGENSRLPLFFSSGFDGVFGG